MIHRLASCLAVLHLFAACGEPYATGRYKGEPLAYLEGTVSNGEEGLRMEWPLFVILWFLPSRSPPPLPEPPGSGTSSGEPIERALSAEEWLAKEMAPYPLSFPDRFSFPIYDPPPEGVVPRWGERSLDVGPGVGIGRLAVVDDVDLDGAFAFDSEARQPFALRPPDRLVALDLGHELFYISDVGTSREQLSGELENASDATPGFHAVRTCNTDECQKPSIEPATVFHLTFGSAVTVAPPGTTGATAAETSPVP